MGCQSLEATLDHLPKSIPLCTTEHEPLEPANLSHFISITYCRILLICTSHLHWGDRRGEQEIQYDTSLDHFTKTVHTDPNYSMTPDLELDYEHCSVGTSAVSVFVLVISQLQEYKESKYPEGLISEPITLLYLHNGNGVVYVYVKW